MTFWRKKLIFNVSDKIYKNVQKWEKVGFDGIFELPIVNLVNIE